MENFQPINVVPIIPEPPKTPWQKTTGGILFLSFLGIIAFVGIAFASLIGYYTWQIKTGRAGDLLKELRPEFSTNEGVNAADQTPIIVENVDQYIRPNNPTRGKSDAPIRIVMFIDFECPFCQKAYPTMEQVIEHYGPAVQLVFKHFPLATIHPNAETAALAATCAEEQDKFWEYYHLLFEKKRFDEPALLSYAKQLNLNETAFSTCLQNETHRNDMEQDMLDGVALGVRGTPTYIMNQIKVEGVIEPAIWDQILIDQLKRIP